MEIKIVETQISVLKPMVANYLAHLASPIDSFLEDHILASKHYVILLNGETAGYCAVHKTSLLTQYYLHDEFKQQGQAVFQRLKKLEAVQAAFVPTADEFFLAHALDEYKQLDKQAYFFQTRKNHDVLTMDSSIGGRLAQPSDTALIKAYAGDFFDEIESSIQKEQIYVMTKEQTCVGFGVLAKSELQPAWASIGMYTRAEFRNQGIGRNIIRYLINECRRQQRQAIAGCWYYNHLSKKTLESAGMYTQTRLLKVSY
ncbi:MAG: GNAT family N-acetyltransferase [Caldilineaceae bacterium]